MGERTSHPPGTFCWTDLVTSDPGAAKTFYGQVLGWQFEDLPTTGSVIARVDGGAVAAIGPLPEAAGGPHFNCYVSVESADEALGRARDLGGEVVLEAGDVGPMGRMGVIADPEGALLAVWQPGEHPGAGVVNVPGALTWNDLTTNDMDDAERFYGDLFGWTFEAGRDDPPYNVIHTASGRPNGGVVAAAEGQPPMWLAYFATADVAAAAARAEEAGAAVISGPTDVPAGTFAVLRDPQGAVFCLFGSSEFAD